MFSRKTKISRYKSEINKSVMLHAFKKNEGIILQCLTKTHKYRVMIVKKLATK